MEEHLGSNGNVTSSGVESNGNGLLSNGQDGSSLSSLLFMLVVFA